MAAAHNRERGTDSSSPGRCLLVQAFLEVTILRSHFNWFCMVVLWLMSKSEQKNSEDKAAVGNHMASQLRLP